MNIDLSGISEDFTAMLTDIVADVTDPQVQEFVAQTLDDYAKLGLMKADENTDEDLILAAQDTLLARTKSLAAIPHLVAADKQQAFLAMVSRMSNVVVGTVFGVARAYLGLPPATPA